jgi:hypothetical protein
MEANTTNELQSLRHDLVLRIEQLDAKAKLYSTPVQDLLKNIGRLHSVSHLDIKELSKRMDNLMCALSKVHDETVCVSKDQRILRSLHFKTIAMRESKIPEAHAATFEWIFSEENTESPFLEWLQNDNGVFWAMGKAGSGKSTLMKFLVNHRLTEQYLQTWAAGKTVVMAKYFFWNAGNELQKSQEGLLRSLLFAILRKCPKMISGLSSDLPPELEDDDSELDIWNLQSLLKLFGSLGQQAEPTTKFCFFVDGLDEYEGDSMDLIKALRALSKLKMVKLCVSSRPWHIFKDEYARPNYRMLKLEDLTRDDIALYVRDVLEEHERFTILQQQDDRYLELVQQIVNKAEGVFLWVSLVVKSLLRGLTSSDRMSDLQRRIELLPPSLEDFFRHMLESVEKVYRKDTFKAFQYVLHASSSGPIPLIVFSYLDEEDPEFASQAQSHLLSQKEIEIREEDMRRRLDGRTRGLLEASARRRVSDVPTVDFLHRTARDFCLTRDMRAMLKEHLDPAFSPNHCLATGFLAQVKLGPIPSAHALASDPFDTVLFYAHELELADDRRSLAVVQNLETVATAPSSHWSNHFIADGSFLGYLVRNNLCLSVSQKLASSPTIKTNSKIPLLHISLTLRTSSTSPTTHYLNPEMVALLLSHGAKPNHNLSFTSTIWTEFMATLYHFGRDRSAVIRTLELLISHGADLEIPVQIRALSGKSLDSQSYLNASEIIRKRYPDEAEWLLGKAPRAGYALPGGLFGWSFFKPASR